MSRRGLEPLAPEGNGVTARDATNYAVPAQNILSELTDELEM